MNMQSGKEIGRAELEADFRALGLRSGDEVVLLGDLNDFSASTLDAAASEPTSAVLAMLQDDPVLAGGFFNVDHPGLSSSC